MTGGGGGGDDGRYGTGRESGLRRARLPHRFLDPHFHLLPKRHYAAARSGASGSGNASPPQTRLLCCVIINKSSRTHR